jgi:molybdopterin/thiamine biosynthesis adenylyltransferase
VRSAFAAKTLKTWAVATWCRWQGFGKWKDEGRAWKVPSPSPRPAPPLPAACCCRSRRGRPGLLLDARSSSSARRADAAALYLAAAGVGTLGIVDMDEVDASNLQRQILHNLDRVGERKVDSAKKTLVGLNPDVNVVTYDTRLAAENVLQLLADYDVVIDGADNFPSRYLLNDASVKLGIPVVHGSIFRFEGMVTVFDPKRGPNYRDMVPEPPPADLAPSCAEAGVLGVLPGIIGSLQALEAIKLLLDLGDPLIGRILSFDALEMTFRTYKLRVDPTNPVTWENRDAIEIAEYDELCAPHLSH